MSLPTFLVMAAFTLLFVTALVFAVVPLGMYRQAAFAVLKRNFAGYFINPTGYVFLALFIVLTSFAAFWPHAFFASNLANFDQLSIYLPYIMLVIIPAITMSTWSEEKRQGTDELLLTLPTTDADIILGKYFASVFIFTVALVLSQIWNVFILILLTRGELDVQLLLTTYLGYWFVGIAMLGIGMVASFLTNNLTVGFILGALFNAPLVFLSTIDSMVPQGSPLAVLARWGLLARLEPFGRGLISASSVIYFLGIAFVAIYLCLILIGRRHWVGARDGYKKAGHYLLRSVALASIVVGLTFLGENTLLSRIRLDASEGGLSSLSPETRAILSRLSGEKKSDGSPAAPIQIEAFVSSEVPAEYAQTRNDLLNLLREFDALGGARMQVVLHNGVEPFSEEASLAEKRFGITPVGVRTRSRGTSREEEVILGAVFTCGLERVIVPFFEYGIPVEYELIRSISTVAQAKRKVLGIVQTDVQMMGGSISGGMMAPPQSVPKEEIVAEFEKQYEVESIDPNSEITVWIEDPQAEGGRRLRYDVMVVAQPSSLGPTQLDNVVKAIRQGQPTAIFEDPVPYYRRWVPGTSEPKRPDPAMAMFGGGAPEPKGDMNALWDLLHIRPASKRNAFGELQPYIIWHAYNPYPQIDDFISSPEFVFVRNDMTNLDPKDRAAGTLLTAFPVHQADPTATSPTDRLEELLFPFPGAIRQAEGKSPLEFIPLVQTGFAGTLSYEDLTSRDATAQSLALKRGTEDGYYVLAARIRTSADAQGEAAASSETPAEGSEANKLAEKIDVIYVSDFDCLASPLVNVRNQPRQGEVNFRMQNPIFALNLIDSLAGESDYLAIRGRGQEHRTLKEMELKTDEEYRLVREAMRETDKAIQSEIEKENEKLLESVRKYQTQVSSMERKKQRGEDVDELELIAKRRLLELQQESIEKRLETVETRSLRERDAKIREANNETRLEIQRTQSWYKGIAVGIPWIPLALIGMGVFAYRRLREREGISKSRLRR